MTVRTIPHAFWNRLEAADSGRSRPSPKGDGDPTIDGLARIIDMALRKNRFLIWAIALWAILSGCLVSDLFVCPWTAVFQ